MDMKRNEVAVSGGEAASVGSARPAGAPPVSQRPQEQNREERGEGKTNR